MLNFKLVSIISIIIFIGLLALSLTHIISFWWLSLPILIWFLITGLGSGLIAWNYHFKSLNHNPKNCLNQVAITFDDGPNLEFTPQVLELLKQYDAKGTFFCIGDKIKQHPNIFKQILAEGHTIGNHTFSHSNAFGFFSTQKVTIELQDTNALITEISGLKPKLYRPAFGVTNPRIKKAIKHLHLTSIGWNKRSLDTTNLSEKTILKRITRNLKSGDVILLHDTSEKTLRVLEQLLLFLQQKKLEAVTVDSLFNIKAYA